VGPTTIAVVAVNIFGRPAATPVTDFYYLTARVPWGFEAIYKVYVSDQTLLVL